MSSFLLPEPRWNIDPRFDGDPGIAPGGQGDPGFAPGGLLGGLFEPAPPDPVADSGLQLLMSPEQIASIDRPPEGDGGQGRESVGLTNGQADSGSSASGGSNGSPGSGYVPGWDHVSLARQDLNPWGLDIPAPAPQSPPPNSGEKYEQGATAAKIFGNGIDWWNDQNKILGLHFGPEGPELLEKYTGPVGKALVGIENGLAAAGEIKNGSPAIPTLAGAGIKTLSTLGAMKLGAEGGAVLGAYAPIPGAPASGAAIGGVAGGILGGLAPGWVYGNPSNQQVGEAAGRVLDNAGRSYRDYVIDNPYYDPRLMAMP